MSPLPDFLPLACESAEPAAVLDALLVRPSRKTCDALVAAFFDVVLLGLTWESELPAAVLEAFPVEPPDSTVDAFFAALAPVDFVAICLPQGG